MEKNFDFFGFVYYLLSVLRTNNEALTAHNTFVSYYIRLVPGETDRLNGAMAYTLIAVFTV